MSMGNRCHYLQVFTQKAHIIVRTNTFSFNVAEPWNNLPESTAKAKYVNSFKTAWTNSRITRRFYMIMKHHYYCQLEPELLNCCKILKTKIDLISEGPNGSCDQNHHNHKCILRLGKNLQHRIPMESCQSKPIYRLDFYAEKKCEAFFHPSSIRRYLSLVNTLLYY